MQKKMDISVVIGSFNQKDRLRRVLEGYVSQKVTVQFEVIVVDSFSTDGTDDMISEFLTTPLQLNFIQRHNPSGKAEARNIGVKESLSPIIIISDADMIPDSHFVQAHYDAHVNSPSVCCYEGLAYNLDAYEWPPNQLTQTQVPKKYKHGDSLDWYYFLTGNISFPKSIFTVENGFSLDFKNYGWEDLELGYRFKKRQIPFKYLTSAINYHYHVITEEEKIERKYHMGKSAKIFIKKHPELAFFLGMNPLSVFIRKRLSKSHVIYRMIAWLGNFNVSFLKSFSNWFFGEYNYLSGLLNLSKN